MRISKKGEGTMLLEGIRFWLRRAGADEKGVTTVEYAIMLALVAVAVALATPGISDAVTSVFDEAATAMTSS
jgi:Flp pilus assembly pilin Flp